MNLEQKSDSDFEKSSTKAVEFCESAMEFEADGKIDRAMKMANMITAFAVDERDLAMGHFTRYQIQKEISHDEAMNHLALALANGVSPTNYTKTKEKSDSEPDFCEQFTKLLQLHDNTKTEQQIVATTQQTKRRKCIQSTLTLKSPSPLAPSLEDFVEIRWEKNRGRHLVTTMDVSIGTVLCVENPMDFGLYGLLDIFSLEIHRCHHCLKIISQPMPCPNCVFVLFCSEKCLKSSDKYHQFECPCFPSFYKAISPLRHPEEKRWVFSFQLLCKLGPEKLYDIFKYDENHESKPESSSLCESTNSNFPGVDPHTQKYTMDSYHTLRQLKLSFAPVDPSAPHLAQTLVKILEEKSTFFENLPLGKNSDCEKFRNFIQNCLINHTRLNCIFLAEKGQRSQNSQNPNPNVTIEYGAVLCPTVKLCSHSCDPNVISHSPNFDSASTSTSNENGCAWSLIAARDLKKGEELTRSYCPRFDLCEKSQRKLLLKAGFDFDCQCHACVFDWPALSLLFSQGDQNGEERKKFMIWTCPNCCHSDSNNLNPNLDSGLKMSQSEKAREENRFKITLKRDTDAISRLKCPSCEFSISDMDLLKKFTYKLQALCKCEGLVNLHKNGMSKEDLNPAEILDEIKDICTFFQSHLLPPSYYQIHAEKIFRQSLLAFLHA